MPADLTVVRITAPGVTAPPNATWSSALRIGDAVHVSGVTARGPDGVARGDTVEGQTLVCFETLRLLLEAAGGGLHNVYKLVVHLVDMRAKDEVSAARALVFGPVYPCSTLVGTSALVFPDLLVEVDAFADLRVDLRRAVEPI